MVLFLLMFMFVMTTTQKTKFSLVEGNEANQIWNSSLTAVSAEPSTHEHIFDISLANILCLGYKVIYHATVKHLVTLNNNLFLMNSLTKAYLEIKSYLLSGIV